MKYRLKKEYPGSPKLGDIATDQGSKEWYRINDSSLHVVKDCHKFPEFWEEVIEKNYKILSLNNPQYHLPIHSKIKLIEGYSNEGFEAKLKEHIHLQIYSVKRLSDGVIFTIGDNVQDSLTDELTNFKVQTISYFYPGEKMICQAESGTTMPLTTIRKAKLPLLKSEDGVQIFENSELWWVAVNEEYDTPSGDKTWSFNEFSWKGIPTASRNYKWFSSKKAAEDYIFMNKPCLSLKDVASIYISADTPIKWDTKTSAQNYKIQGLVKSRL